MSLKISSTVSLPKQAGLWTFAFLAIKGAGKTYGACKLAEEMIKTGIPIVAIDPLGIWWGLRAGSEEGKTGLPVVIFGGDHKDLPIPVTIGKYREEKLDEDKLKLLVKSFLEAGLSVVIDTSLFSKNNQRRAGAIICDELFHQNAHYGVRHVFIEETDMLAPQHIAGELAFSKGAVDDLVRRGGNFNLGCTLISQRSAVVNKDILTQCNCLVALRIQAKLDKDAVKTWIENVVADDRERRKLGKWYDSLRGLENGEAWIYSPEHKIELTKFRFAQRETLHASREYFLQEHWEQKNIRMMDVNAFINRFKEAFEPKPKIVQEDPIAKQAGVPASFSSKSAKAEISLSEPPVATGNSPIQQTIDILRSNPLIQTQKSLVTIMVPSDVDHPKTPLGKIAVVMKDDSRHNQHWTLKRVRTNFERREWPIDGIEEAFNQMISWGILRIQSNRAYTFYPSRVEVTEKEVTVIVP